MSRKHSKLWVVATVAVAASGAALADDNSMSIWTGNSYAYFNGGQNFPYGNPVFDQRPSSFRQTDPHGLSFDEYQAASSDGRPWPLPNPSDATTIASMAAAKAWRQDHPHGLPNSVYEAWSADGRPWPLPSATSALASSDTGAPSGLAKLFALMRARGDTPAN